MNRQYLISTVFNNNELLYKGSRSNGQLTSVSCLQVQIYELEEHKIETWRGECYL